jgi:hypothetical protein
MRPARQCRSPKASFATPAGKPIPKVGSAAPTAVSTRCGPVRTVRSASTCSGSCRSSSSGPGRRMSVARVAVAEDVLHGPMPGRNNSSASEAAMAVRNGRNAAVRSHNVLLSSSKGRRSNRHHRKPRESGRDAVAAVVAAANQQNLPRPIRTRPRSNRGRRASRVLRARPRPRARILSLLARMAERRAPRATVQNDGDASDAAAAVVAVVVDPRRRRHNGGCAALSVIGRFCRNAASRGPKSHQIGLIPLQTDRNRIKSDRYRSKLDRCRIKLDRYRSRLDRYRSRLDRCRSKLDRYRIKLDRWRSKLDRYRIELDRYRIELDRQPLTDNAAQPPFTRVLPSPAPAARPSAG